MLEDTSFAIHPSKTKNNKDNSYHEIGNLIKFDQEENRIYRFRCEAGDVKLLFYRKDILRVIMNPFDEASLTSSPAVIVQEENMNVSTNENEDSISIFSELLQVRIQKRPFRITILDKQGEVIVKDADEGMGYRDGHHIFCYKEMNENDHFYGLGEKAGFLDKRGEKFTMWNTDVYAPHNPETDALYQSIPYFMALREGKAYGIFFDNTYKTAFDFKTDNNKYSFMAEGGQLDYYILAGPSPKDVIEQYTYLTGRITIPPKWAIGYHQSRYSYETDEEVYNLANIFIEKKIPVDAVYLDIHYMDEYRVFTFDRNRFHNPQKMVADLKKVGLRVVPIVDPGVKKDSEYKYYQKGVMNNYFCKYLEGDIYFGDVWPGTSAFPDFANSEVRSWWGENHKFYTELGIEGIWNDMNEPAIFNETKTMDLAVAHDYDGELKTHREFHNLYGFLMGKATYEGLANQLKGKRPFLLTRAGYAGIQRYAAVWTGDNRSFWEHLSMSIPMILNLGVSGIPLAGADVGGFAHDTTGELLTRWTQLGAFTPYFRNHSAINTNRQEPWAFGESYEKIIKKYIELRYNWLPQFYNLFVEANRTGLPVMRPLFMEYSTDKNTFNLSDQFMLGDNVIIAPILVPNSKYRVVYLPEGEWYDYWTDNLLEGNKHVLVEAPLDTLPIFIKAGSQIIHGQYGQSTMFEKEDFILHVYPSAMDSITSSIYDDDGETFDYQKGKFLEKVINYQFKNNDIDIFIEDKVNDYKPNWKNIIVFIHNKEIIGTIRINGVLVDKDKITYEKEKRIVSFKIRT